MILPPLTFATEESRCEQSLSTPAKRFLRTLRSGLAQHLINADDLNWMAAQPHPVDPLRQPRNPQNIFLKQQFQANAPYISTDQWKLIIKEATRIGQRERQEENKAKKVHEETKNVFFIAQTNFGFPQDAKILDLFTSSQGEVFIALHQYHDAYILNPTTGNQFKFECSGRLNKKFVDFFETSKGEVFFAVNCGGRLVVHNVRTGMQVLTWSNDSEQMVVHPIFYEVNEKLNLMVAWRGTGSIGNSIVEPKSGIAYRNVQINFDGTEPVVTEVERYRHVVRLADGHLYSQNADESYGKLSVNVFDLSRGKEVFTTTVTLLDRAETTTALIFDHGPKVVLKNAWHNWYEVASEVSEVKKLKIVDPMKEDFIFHNHKDRATDIHRDRHNAHQLIIQRLIDGETTVISFPPRMETRLTWSDESIPTPHGLWTYGWEWTFNKRTALMMYNLDTQEVIRLALTAATVAFTGAPSIFYSKIENRMYMIAGEDILNFRLFQIWGPERHRQ